MVGCVGAAEGLTAVCAEPDGVFAGAGAADECGYSWGRVRRISEEIRRVRLERRVGQVVRERYSTASST